MGIDASSPGWIAVVLRPGGVVEARHLATIGELPAAVPDAEVVGIDIPLHLPAHGRRRAEVEARRTLGARRSSLFFTPSREALAAATHAEATALAAAATGHGVSRQSYGLAAKVFEVEAWLGSAPCPVHEVHPELSFAHLLGQPAGAAKKTWAGMVERRAALAGVGIDLDQVGQAAASRAAVDDMLDAGAAAWTAIRLLAGTARPYPDPPEMGPDGTSTAIWA